MKAKHTVAVLALVGWAAQTNADQHYVDLRSLDQTISLSGELLSYDDESYTIRTSVGDFRIGSDRVYCIGQECPPTQNVFAHYPDKIILVSRDGDWITSGSFVRLEDGHVVLKSEGSDVKIALAGTDCVGNPCAEIMKLDKQPLRTAPSDSFSIAMSDELSDKLFVDLLEGYSATKGSQFLKVASTDQGQQNLEFSDGEGELLANMVLTSSTPDVTIGSLLDGAVQLAATTKSLGINEWRALTAGDDGGSDDARLRTVVGRDALAIVMSSDAPVASLSQRELALVYSGAVTNWRELHGPDLPIKAYAVPSTTVAGKALEGRLLTPHGLSLSDKVDVLKSGAAVIAAAQSEPGAIGLVNFSSLDGAAPLPLRDHCGDTIAPSPFAIKTGAYPLTSPVYLYKQPGDQVATADAFIDYVKSDAAQDILRSAGIVDRGVAAASLSAARKQAIIENALSNPQTTARRAEEMLAALKGAERLSMAFRFDHESTELLPRAEQELQRLVSMLDEGALNGKDLLVAGFTDAWGRADENRALSRHRAQRVRDHLIASLEIPASAAHRIKIFGFGELAPVGCNREAWGRELNRRVEIWIRDRDPAHDARLVNN